MTQLNLIKTGVQDVEKRIFPRFPFSALIFRAKGERSFEVVDISHTGMQLTLKDGGHEFRPEENLNGEIHWRGASINIQAMVKWTKGMRMGVEFVADSKFQKEIRVFLSIDNLASHLRSVHDSHLDLEIPAQLKYWLQADGPVELFVWRHNDGEVSRFQVLLLENFLEWEDGKGVRTGRILTKRNLDTPLFSEDEYMFQIDDSVDTEKLQSSSQLIQCIRGELLPREALEFMTTKLDIK